MRSTTARTRRRTAIGATARRRAHRRRAIEALPDTIELIVLGVRAGRTATNAVVAARDHAPDAIRPIIDEVERRLARGQQLADALHAFADALGTEAVGFVDELATAERYGEPIGPVLDRLAVEARTERHRQAERRARRLPVTLTFPLVTCTLPAFVLIAVAPALLGAVATLRDNAP